jgi:hypothetical protein
MTVSSALRVLTKSIAAGSDNLTDLRPLLRVPPQQAWQTNRAILAATLIASEWYAVARAYESLDLLRRASTDDLFVDDGRRLFHRFVEDLVLDLANTVQAGAAALSRLAGDPHPRAESSTLEDRFRDSFVAYTAGQSSTSDPGPKT